MLTEVRDTLLALYARRNDFNADNQIVVNGYTNFVFIDLPKTYASRICE